MLTLNVIGTGRNVERNEVNVQYEIRDDDGILIATATAHFPPETSESDMKAELARVLEQASVLVAPNLDGLAISYKRKRRLLRRKKV